LDASLSIRDGGLRRIQIGLRLIDLCLEGRGVDARD
jgi:hypothetical protein